MSKIRIEDWGLLVLRLAAGGLMLSHGWPKVGLLFEAPQRFPDPIGIGAEVTLGIAVFAEVICAGLVVIGLLTRWATAPLLATMLIAAFVQHAGDPFQQKELALLYAGGYLALLLTGPGRLSVDTLLRR